MCQIRRRLDKLISITEYKPKLSFMKRDYVVTWRQDALEEEMKKIAASQVFRRLFMNDRDLLRKVKRKENYYTRLAKAKEEDAQEAAQQKNEDEARYARYCSNREKALPEQQALENEWQAYSELYERCTCRVKSIRIICDLVCERHGLYNELAIIEYLCESYISFENDTLNTYLERCYDKVCEYQHRLEEKEKEYYYIIND